MRRMAVYMPARCGLAAENGLFEILEKYLNS